MNVLIISIDHVVQRARRVLELPGPAGKKDRLEALIRQEIATRNIQFISEEADPRIRTIAQEIATSQQPTIPWMNIVMTEQQRRNAGIFEALQNRPVDRRPTFFGYVEIEHRVPADDVRENFFMAQTITGAGAAQSALVLCGDVHTEALAAKFTAGGHTAATNDSLCPDKHWVP
jgi:hypothetical protein